MICLLNGPIANPPVLPQCARYIVFTSQSHWLKNEHDVLGNVLYMPIWMLEELKLANKTMAPEIEDEVIERRFEVFRGNPWHALDRSTIKDSNREKCLTTKVKETQLSEIRGSKMNDHNLPFNVHVGYQF